MVLLRTDARMKGYLAERPLTKAIEAR